MDYGNSPDSIKYTEISVANSGIILAQISVGLQAVDLTFTVAYRPDLLIRVTDRYPWQRIYHNEIG